MSFAVMQEIVIVDFEPRYAEAFARLNYAWIEKYFEIEPNDRHQLEHPDQTIIESGGYIKIATLNDKVVGVGALIPSGVGVYELAKMAVAEEAQGKGIGYKIASALIEQAKALGATTLELLTNTKLGAATHLYYKLGFVEATFDAKGYKRADLKMELHLRD
jgi:GNAT superfamily N-acetyltransferase